MYKKDNYTKDNVTNINSLQYYDNTIEMYDEPSDSQHILVENEEDRQRFEQVQNATRSLVKITFKRNSSNLNKFLYDMYVNSELPLDSIRMTFINNTFIQFSEMIQYPFQSLNVDQALNSLPYPLQEQHKIIQFVNPLLLNKKYVAQQNTSVLFIQPPQTTEQFNMYNIPQNYSQRLLTFEINTLLRNNFNDINIKPSYTPETYHLNTDPLHFLESIKIPSNFIHTFVEELDSTSCDINKHCNSKGTFRVVGDIPNCKCYCRNGFTGDRCEPETVAERTESKTTSPLLVIFIIFIILFSISYVVYFKILKKDSSPINQDII